MTSKLIDHDRYKISYFYKLTSTIVSDEIFMSDMTPQFDFNRLIFELSLKCIPEKPIIAGKKLAKID